MMIRIMGPRPNHALITIKLIKRLHLVNFGPQKEIVGP